MTWRNLKDYPNHTGQVLVVDAWGDRFAGSCSRNEDGSREWHAVERYIGDSDKYHRYRWAEIPPPPTDEEWEATSENR